MYFLLSILPLLLMIGALVDLITIDPSRVKHLPKFGWIIIAILLPLIGSILWFVIGREYVQVVDRGGFGDPRRREQSTAPAMDFGRAARAHRMADSGDTEAQLAALNREIAAHERAERIRHLEEELEAKRREKGSES